MVTSRANHLIHCRCLVRFDDWPNTWCSSTLHRVCHKYYSLLPIFVRSVSSCQVFLLYLKCTHSLLVLRLGHSALPIPGQARGVLASQHLCLLRAIPPQIPLQNFFRRFFLFLFFFLQGSWERAFRSRRIELALSALTVIRYGVLALHSGLWNTLSVCDCSNYHRLG